MSGHTDGGGHVAAPEVVWLADAEGDSIRKGERGFYLWAADLAEEAKGRAVAVRWIRGRGEA